MTEFTRPYLYPKQLDAIFCPERYGIIEASTKSGKAQPLDALVYTPSGPIAMGDVLIGEDVLGHDGKIYKVLDIFPQGLRQSYIVTFNDKTEVECDGDHLWEVQYYDKPSEVLTTKQLSEIPKWRFVRTNVPKINPVAFSVREVPLDPYLIGVLIGDGNLTVESARLSCAGQEILDHIETMLPNKYSLKKATGDNHDYAITVSVEEHQNVRREQGTLLSILDTLGMKGKYSFQKGIPELYRYNSEEVRWALLQGIMDTDGSVNEKGQPVLEQTSEQLAKDIAELVQSLGGSVKTTSDTSAGYWARGPISDDWMQGRRRYRQSIRLGEHSAKCFRLTRKRVLVSTPKKTGNRLLKSIHAGRMVEMQCIKVSNPRQLYLTNGLIPTHNTVGSIAWFVEQGLKGKPGWNYWWVAPGYNQAEIAYRRIKQGLTKGSFTAFDTPTPRIHLLNGTVIWFKSADNPDALYGEDVYAAVIDEASRVAETSWHAIRSTLTATRGPVRIIGNVKGRKNWFYALARRAEAEMLAQPDSAKRRMHYSRITADDAVNAGVLDKDEIEDARETYPENVFRELYFAEPGDDTGNPFGLDHIRSCMVSDLSPGPVVAWGIDLAKKQDYFVCIGLNENGGVAQFHRWRGVPWRRSIQRVWQLVGEDCPALVDSTGVGDPVLEELQYEHGNFMGFHFSQTSKQKLMEGLAVSIQSHEVQFPAGFIAQELELFEYEVTRTGVRYSAPEGHNDDCVAALALARQMWTEVQPGANMMQYYANVTRTIQEREEQIANDNKTEMPWRDNLMAHNDIVTNELEDLYREAVAKTLPNATRKCFACGNEVSGNSRVTDGEYFWHVECRQMTRPFVQAVA